MSLALHVSLLSFTSIVDMSPASLRKTGVGRMGKGFQMFVLSLKSDPSLSLVSGEFAHSRCLLFVIS